MKSKNENENEKFKHMNITEFLMNTDLVKENKEVIISERLKNYPITIRPIMGNEWDMLKLNASNKTGGNDNKLSETLSNELLIEYVVVPDLKDIKLLEKYECITPQSLISKIFTSGEKRNIETAIFEHSDFNISLEKLQDLGKS